MKGMSILIFADITSVAVHNLPRVTHEMNGMAPSPRLHSDLLRMKSHSSHAKRVSTTAPKSYRTNLERRGSES
ncbi:hypothetical protein M404DRAFT_996865 [Pisolithus tinctorius Marx 270]|uniref:Uncharacterized protein n=1 Tax=Pisolithus tinctorius Marx 270 TaxID=870435 RepID=A0A0C3JJI9_PISTI|nr:hypothetical protein M404DRAFT_996865 [Pisolithus tinctorius Marx 270]